MIKEFIDDELYKKAVLNLNKNLGLDFESILKKVDETGRVDKSNNCSVVGLCDLLAGELTGEERKRVEHHLETCDSCKKLATILRSKNPHARTKFKRHLLPRLGSLLHKSSRKKRQPICLDYAHRVVR